jgi:hypothetical protein
MEDGTFLSGACRRGFAAICRLLSHLRGAGRRICGTGALTGY